MCSLSKKVFLFNDYYNLGGTYLRHIWVGQIVVDLGAKQFDVYSVVLIKILSLEVSARYASDGMSL